VLAGDWQAHGGSRCHVMTERAARDRATVVDGIAVNWPHHVFVNSNVTVNGAE